jgi:hypothetical protein
MKWLRAVRHPISHWAPLTLLTWPILAMIEILLGFASMSCSVMMHPKSLPQGTPQVHFSRFNLMWKRLRLLRVSFRSAMRLVLYRDFTTMALT